MTTLANFPFVNQINDTDSNVWFDCVPASLVASIAYLSGIAIHPSVLKDAVYGQSYIGPTAIGEYVTECLSYGIRLSPVSCSSPQEALAHAHSMLTQNMPVVFTQQDDYAPAHPDWTHVCVWYADNGTSLTAMDPMGGKAVIYNDATWATRLRDNTIWTMEKIMSVPTLWNDDPNHIIDGKVVPTLTAPNGIPVVAGFRDYVLNHPWDSRNWPVAKEEGRTPLEDSNTSLGGGSQQLFKYRPLEWTPSKGVFEAYTGAEILFLRSTIATLQAQTMAQDKTITDLTTQIAALQAQQPSQDPQVAVLQAQIAKYVETIQTIVTILQKGISTPSQPTGGSQP